MSDNILITLLDGEKIEITGDTLLTCIVKTERDLKTENTFYSQIIYQNFPLNEEGVTFSAATSSPFVGLMGLFAEADFFTLQDDIDADNAIVYKTSAIKSLSFA